MKKLPYCRECKYFGGEVIALNINGIYERRGMCKCPRGGGIWRHILNDGNWCINGEFVENEFIFTEPPELEE